MKKIITLLAFSLLSVTAFSQAFEGKGDQKFSIGANMQNHGTGITAIYDFGVGQNISFGFAAGYLLGVEEPIDAEFGDRFDLKVRFNANLSDVINLSENFDVYPGLDLSLKNFGGHVGARYFFTEGFGLFAEGGFPIAKYNTDDLTIEERFHNQFVFNLGVSFNL